MAHIPWPLSQSNRSKIALYNDPVFNNVYYSRFVYKTYGPIISQDEFQSSESFRRSTKDLLGKL